MYREVHRKVSDANEGVVRPPRDAAAGGITLAGATLVPGELVGRCRRPGVSIWSKIGFMYMYWSTKPLSSGVGQAAMTGPDGSDCSSAVALTTAGDSGPMP
jgi:hypothetical protein